MPYTDKWVVSYEKMATGTKTFYDAEDAANFANTKSQQGTFKNISHVREEEVSLPRLVKIVSDQKRKSA